MIGNYLRKNKKLAHDYCYRPEEIHQPGKSFDSVDITFCMCSVAPQGGLQFTIGSDIIYNLARKRQDVYADMGVIYNKLIMELIGCPSYSFYAECPIRDFDFVGISVYFVGSYFNIAPFLSQIGVPLLSKDRPKLNPLIIGGGGAISSNPEPVADFFDVLIIGDGETPMSLLFDFYKENKDLKKKDFLLSVSKLHSAIYVPSLKNEKTRIYYNVEDDISGSVLASADFVSKPKNKTIELIRGCYYKCDFCNLSYMRKKAVKMPVEKVIESIQSYPEKTSIYPFAPDESSYPQYQEIYEALGDRKLYRFNQRFNTYNKLAKHSLNDMRVSFGLDGISQRVRDFINKKITKRQIIDSLRHAFKNFYEIKINLIIAFPFEGIDDWEEFESFMYEICEMRLAVAPEKCLNKEESKEIKGKLQKEKIEGRDFDMSDFLGEDRKLLMVSLNPTPFQAEPHTPMQNLPIGDVNFATQKLYVLQKKLIDEYGMIKIEGMNSEKAIQLEYILKRGGRELTKCLLDLFSCGYYNAGGLSNLLVPFFRVLRNNSIDKDKYLGWIKRGDKRVWDFIVTGLEAKCEEIGKKYERP